MNVNRRELVAIFVGVDNEFELMIPTLCRKTSCVPQPVFDKEISIVTSIFT